MALISALISKSIVGPVEEMVLKFRIIARGNLNTEISINTNNEIGHLASSFREIQSGLNEIIEYTKKVATGDYSTQITPRSNEDELSVALNKMVVQLKKSYEKAEQDSWYKSGINLINEKLSGDQSLNDISKLLQKTPLNDDQKELISIIIASGENLSLIINDILDFSKIESGQIQLGIIDFELKTLVKNVFQLMKFKADENGIGLNYFISDKIPAILNGDPLRINQILMNLVNNAIKFTHKGKVDIHIEPIDRSENTVRLLFRVIDTGIGITEEGKQLLFKEFSQAESSISREYGGTGLGLAISKNLVALMNGEIGVNSEWGHGSEFWFRLPLKEAAISEIPDENKAHHIPSNINILLAEDNRINQKVATLTLKQLGFECDIANNGREALKMYEQNRYDLILMDMQMPEVDGIQATKMIREFEKSAVIKYPCYIVAMTANVLDEDKQLCLQVGMDNFLSKPFTENELRNILLEVVRHQEKH